MLPFTDLSRMSPSPTAIVPAVIAVVANVPALTKVTSPPGLETVPRVPTLLPRLSSVTEPVVFVTARTVAVMAADWVTVPAAVIATVLPVMPATSKPFLSV